MCCHGTSKKYGTALQNFVLTPYAHRGNICFASSSLGASRELHLALFPQGQSRPGLASQNWKCNYENEQQN
jgi:hypothetical protein